MFTSLVAGARLGWENLYPSSRQYAPNIDTHSKLSAGVSF